MFTYLSTSWGIRSYKQERDFWKSSAWKTRRCIPNSSFDLCTFFYSYPFALAQLNHHYQPIQHAEGYLKAIVWFLQVWGKEEKILETKTQMTSLHSDLGQSHRNKLRTRQSLLRAAQEETGPEPTNQDILTQSSPPSCTGHAVKRSPDKCFTETSEHKLSFRWEYTSECKVNGFLVTSFCHFGLPVIKQNFFPIYLKLGRKDFSKTTWMSELQGPQIYQLSGPIYHVKQWIYHLWQGEFKSLGTKNAFLYWSQDNY